MYGVDPHAGMTVTVKGISLNRDFQSNSKTVYNIVGETAGKTVYGVNHMGSTQGWNDQFAVNYKNLQYDDLDLVAYANDQQIGRGHLNMIQVTRNPQAVFDQEIQLRKNGNVVGYLPVQVNRSAKQQIVGGLKPPVVTLKTNPYDEQPLQSNNVGLQQIRSNNRNLFSCMDTGSGWEFMPYNFQTKTRQYYDNVNLGRTQSSSQQGGLYQQIKSKVGRSNNVDNQEPYISRVGTVNDDHIFDTNQLSRPISGIERQSIQPLQPTGIHTFNEAPGTRYTGGQQNQSIQMF